MRRLLTLAGLLAALSAAACAPNPILARDPVPAPSPDAAYGCASRPIMFGFYDSNCERVVRPPEPVVRARG